MLTLGKPEGYVHSAEKLVEILYYISKTWVEEALNLVYRLFGKKR